MRKIRAEYEFPVEGRAWTQGTLPSAGVFFLDGDCHIVPRNGPAALDLEQRGAFLVALVRFDGSSGEDAAPSRPVRSLDLREAVARFAPDEPSEGVRRAGHRRSALFPDPSSRHADP